MKKKYENAAAATIHEGVVDLYKVGVVNKVTMQKFDVLCRKRPLKMAPKT